MQPRERCDLRKSVITVEHGAIVEHGRTNAPVDMPDLAVERVVAGVPAASRAWRTA